MLTNKLVRLKFVIEFVEYILDDLGTQIMSCEFSTDN